MSALSKKEKVQQERHQKNIAKRVDGLKQEDLSDFDLAKLAKLVKNDSWASFAQGLGIMGRDKRTAGNQQWTGNLFTETQAEQTLAGSNLARRLVEYLPYEATRQWIELKGFEDDEKAICDAMEMIDVQHAFFTAWCWARTYGGSGLIMMTEEGEDALELPMWKVQKDFTKPPELVNPDNRITSLIPCNRWELEPWSSDIDTDLTSPNFRKPIFYRLSVVTGGIRVPLNIKIHFTRIIRFDGNPLPPLLFIRNNYWGDSIFTGLMEGMRDYDMSHSGVARILNEYRMIVHKMPDIAEKIANGQDKGIRKRVMAAIASRNSTGEMVVDKEEDIEIHADTFAGVDAMLDRMGNRFAAHTEYPKIILFNESPEGGLGSKGNSELESWYNTVEARQHTYLAPKIDQFLRVFLAMKKGPLQGTVPDDWSYEFASLWQESAMDQATREKLEAEADDIRINQGTQDAVDIMEKRFPEKLEDKDPEELRKEIEAEKEKQMAAEQDRAKLALANNQGNKPAPVEPKK